MLIPCGNLVLDDENKTRRVAAYYDIEKAACRCRFLRFDAPCVAVRIRKVEIRKVTRAVDGLCLFTQLQERGQKQRALPVRSLRVEQFGEQRGMRLHLARVHAQQAKDVEASGTVTLSLLVHGLKCS